MFDSGDDSEASRRLIFGAKQEQNSLYHILGQTLTGL